MTTSTDLFLDLVRAETRLYNLVDARIRTAHDGLSAGQLQLLQVIDEVPGCRVADVIRAVDITVGAASKAVDRLEALGLCRRVDNPQDRRSSILELTEHGQETYRSAWPTLGRAVADLTAGLSAGELEQVARTLATLRAQLESAGGSSEH